MHDEAAFLQAIHEAPADDAPRLVYADWLDERGDPRGLFLRDECRAAERFRAGKPTAARRLRRDLEKGGQDWALSVARPPVGVCSCLTFSKSGRAVSGDELDAAASRAGISLPPDYRAFLQLHNGGEPRPNQFAFEHDGEGQTESVEAFVPFKPRDGFRSVFTMYQGHTHEPLVGRFESLLPIATLRSDEDCLALSVAPEDAGAVYYQMYIEGLREPIPLAASFAEFLSSLADLRLDWVRMAEDGDAEGLRKWLDSGGDMFVRDPENDFTPLDCAICYGRVEVVKTILDRKPRFTRKQAANVRDMITQYPNRAIRKLVDEYLAR